MSDRRVTSPMTRKIHNIMAAQSRKGWTVQDVERAIADARQGVTYPIPPTRCWLNAAPGIPMYCDHKSCRDANAVQQEG